MRNTTWLIYKHTSTVSGKSYIGLTKFSVGKRWAEHKNDAMRDRYPYAFHNAIRYHGTEDWEHTILHNDIPTIEEANALERYYIAKYCTYSDGYNSTVGGEGVSGRMYSKEELDVRNSKVEKKRFIHFQHGYVELTLRDMVDTYGGSKGNYSMVISGERPHAKGWQSYDVVGDTPKDYRKKEDPIVVFYHKEYGTEKCTTKQLAQKYNLNISKIRGMVRGDAKYVKGWTMSKIGKDESYRTGVNEIKRHWYNKDTDEERYCSGTALCKEFNLSSGTLSMVVAGDRKTHGGWVYAGPSKKQAGGNK